MSTDSCRSCSASRASRRDFLKIGATSGMAMFAAAAFGLADSASAVALPVSYVTGTGGAPNEKRYPLPAGDGASIDRSAQVIVVRLNGQAFAFALSCPHENAAVKWLPKDGRFQCSKHDSQYTPAGVHTSGRATRNMDRYAIRKDETGLAVDLNRWFRSDQDPTGWTAAVAPL